MANILRPNKLRKSKDGKKISQKTNVWKSPSTLHRVNNHINHLSKKGQVLPIRQEKNKLMISVPKENAIYTYILDDKGYVKQISRF
ncbi:hypothetical protein JV173_03350 [Acholeplasma equirhinis]|uniref:hypothetical protein n=1 Tax=Acholeplasma equirhinis TaxID=555393 RepID=UPI00197AF5D6|nr:hypothetical protein [Acholeplasma equirhinis]MBN3490545.1 hypothetical protein [Acholeplasma equirhinis]